MTNLPIPREGRQNSFPLSKARTLISCLSLLVDGICPWLGVPWSGTVSPPAPQQAVPGLTASFPFPEMSQGEFPAALCLLDRELLRGFSASFAPCFLGSVSDLEHITAPSSHGSDATRRKGPHVQHQHIRRKYLRRAEPKPCRGDPCMCFFFLSSRISSTQQMFQMFKSGDQL